MSDPVEIRPGLCSVTFRSLTPTAIIPLAAAAGLGAIEWAADAHVLPGDHAAAAAVARRCADAGIACASYGSYLFAGATDGRGDGAAEVIETAVALGAPNVRVWCEWGSPVEVGAAQRAAVVAAVAAITARAADAGLTVSLELHPHTLTETAASTVALLDEVGDEALFTYWQPDPRLGPAELLAELGAVLPRLSHLHVFRWRADATRSPLAAGTDLWPEALMLARTPGAWHGPRLALLEFVRGDDPDQLMADAVVLRRWLGLSPPRP